MKLGPSIDELTHYLAECPQDFLAAPRPAAKDGIHVDAVVFDTLLVLGATVSHKALSFFRASDQPVRVLKITLITCWLLNHPWFKTQGLAEAAHTALLELPAELAPLLKPEDLVTDPDRREELTRLLLRWLKVNPKDETQAHAADRLKSISSVERKRLLNETRAQVEHAQRLRRAMAEQKAREAASRYTGE